VTLSLSELVLRQSVKLDSLSRKEGRKEAPPECEKASRIFLAPSTIPLGDLIFRYFSRDNVRTA